MYTDYNEAMLIKDCEAFKAVDERPAWVNGAGRSVESIIRSYESFYVKTGKETVKEIHRILKESKSHLIENTSSYLLVDMILSGKYDKKLALCTDHTYMNNCIVSGIVNEKLYSLQVTVADEFYRKAPTDYYKRLDWIYANFNHIFVHIDTFEKELEKERKRHNVE